MGEEVGIESVVERAVATASANYGYLWTDFEGRELNGGWRLKRLVRSEGRTAWFEASGPEGKPAMLSITETLNDEGERMARLRATGGIRHENVVRIYEARIVRMSDVPMVIAAMEPTEENLEDVLRERALTVAEARQVLEAMLAGLGAIHAKGLIHGRMEASSVLATGETIKLRSDCLQIGGEGFASGVGEDVRGVGRVVTRALTRRIPSGENDPVLQLVPEPLARAVRQALTGRCSVEQMAELAGVRAMPRPGPQVEMRPAAAGSGSTAVSGAAAARPQGNGVVAGAAQEAAAARPMRKEPAMAEPAARPRAGAGEDLLLTASVHRGKDEGRDRTAKFRTGRNEADRHEANLHEANLHEADRNEADGDEAEAGGVWWRRGPFAVAAAVTLLAITLFVIYGMFHDGNDDRPAEAAVATPVKRPARPMQTIVEHAKPRAAAASTAERGNGNADWRVIIYTYDSRSDAQRKAAAMAKKYPGLHPRALATNTGRHYLVVLGPPMERNAAMRLREKAIRMGLPRDTYAQNVR